MKKKKKNTKKNIFPSLIKRNIFPNPIKVTFQIKETVWSGNRPTIGYVAQFKEDKMTFHAISSPTHVEAILKPVLDLFAKINSMAPSSQSIIVSNEIIASTYYKRIIKKIKAMKLLKEPQVH